MPDVDSRAVSHISYQRRHKRLYVTFRGSGGSYVYIDVPQRKYDALMKADSVGVFINKWIKPYYKCQRLEDA
jgi:hypothetical protein